MAPRPVSVDKHPHRKVDDREDTANNEDCIAGKAKPFKDPDQWLLKKLWSSGVPIGVGEGIIQLEHANWEEVDEEHPASPMFILQKEDLIASMP